MAPILIVNTKALNHATHFIHPHFPFNTFQGSGQPSFLNIAFIPWYYFSKVDWVPNIHLEFYWWSVPALLAWSAPSHDAQQCRSVCCKFINQLCIISLGQKLIIEFQQEPLSSTLTIQSCIYLLHAISPHPWRQQVYKGPRGKESLGYCWPLMQNWMGCECNLFNSWCLNV